MSEKFEGFNFAEYQVIFTSPRESKNVDITKLVGKLELNSSIYDFEVWGSFNIFDTSGFFSGLKLEGDEIITISIKQRTGQIFKRAFLLFKVSDTEFNETNKKYICICHIISPLGYYISSNNISKSFDNQKPEEILKYALGNSVTTNGFYVEPCKNILKYFVAPFWSVLRIIDYMVSVAVSKRTNSPYVFFERLDGDVNFVSLGSIVEFALSEKDNLSVFTNIAYLNDKPMIDFIKDADYKISRNVQNFRIIDSVDTISRVKNGGFVQENVVVDLLNRESISKKKSLKDKNKNFSYQDSNLLLESKVSPNNRNVVYRDILTHPLNQMEKSEHNIFLSSFEKTQIEIMIEGDLSIGSGTPFKFYTSSFNNEGVPEHDKFISGIYIAVKSNHHLLNNNFITYVVANKIGEL